MEINLKKITDKTLNKLAHNQIILPSAYFKTFNDSAKELNVDVFDDNFNIELENVLNQEYEEIGSFMDKTIFSIDTLTQATNDAQKAISSKDEVGLEAVSQKIINLKKEMLSIKKLIFVDEITNTLNRKWIYKRFLDEKANFKDSGTIALIFINDYSTFIKKYGQNIADNVLIYITRFLTKNFLEKKLNIDIAKYSENQFLLIYKDGDEKLFKDLLKEIKETILTTTLQSKSGIKLKTQFDYTISNFKKGRKFQNIIDILVDKERG